MIETILNESNKKIRAVFDHEKVIVYQAFNNRIADEAIKLNRFGELFNMNRMTWIKTSFLWMMYRSKWGTEINQERILSIDVRREGFDIILSNAILSKYDNRMYPNYLEWKKLNKNTDIICQWDPDRDVYGNKLQDRALQLGLRGKILQDYIEQWIIGISDVTKTVNTLRDRKLDKQFDASLLPVEKDYPINDIIQYNLGIGKRCNNGF